MLVTSYVQKMKAWQVFVHADVGHPGPMYSMHTRRPIYTAARAIYRVGQTVKTT